ncbi:MAG: DUF1282 domain-containing protein [Rhodopseudomonas sp.]|nr:DUF1282 domain-containing protein [Rhodopseudomonas sp.]
MNLVERVKALLQTPKEEWPKIEAETEDLGSLFWGYAAPLALIPPAASFIGMVFTGYVGLRVDPALGLIRSLIVYLLSLASIPVMAFILNGMAATFGGRKNFTNAMKVAIFAPTAFWVAGVFAVQPPLAFLSLLGLYSFCLLFTGIAALMKPPAAKVLTYTIAVSACMIVLWAVIVGGTLLTFGFKGPV